MRGAGPTPGMDLKCADVKSKKEGILLDGKGEFLKYIKAARPKREFSGCYSAVGIQSAGHKGV